MKQYSVLFYLAVLVLLVFIYYCYCREEEEFYIPPSEVTGGDFHIQPVGAIADQGSFTNVMDDYIDGQGPI